MRAIVWMLVGIVVAALAVGGYVIKTKYDAFMAQLGDCRRDRDEQAKQLGAIATERDKHKSSRADSEKVAADAEATLSATRAELEELRRQRGENEQRLAAFNELTSKLQKMIDTGKLKVLVRGGRMVVKLPAEVFFDSGKADLSPTGRQALAEIAAVLKEFRDRKFMVAGHTDNLPVSDAKHRNNWELSTARAVTVTEFLVLSGLRPTNLVAAGYGEFAPVGSNSTPAGRQDNRRIEIELLPNVDELPKLLDQTKGAAASSATPAASASAP